jgi:DNA-binding response OmpR family regulator
MLSARDTPTKRIPHLELVTTAADHRRTDRGRPAVLIVSRKQGEIEYLEKALAALGLDAIAAANEDAAVNLFGEHREKIALVLLDTGHAGLNSAKLLACLRVIQPRLRHCFLVGPGRSRRLGESYLRKPFDAAAITKVVRELLTNDKPGSASGCCGCFLHVTRMQSNRSSTS